MSETDLEKRLERIEDNTKLAALSNKVVLTFEEAARYCGLSHQYLYKLTSTKQIPHSKPTGKMLYFDRKDLEEWLTRNKITTKEEADTNAAAYVIENPRKGVSL